MQSAPEQVNARKIEEQYPLHALEYHWDHFDPHLICYDSSDRDVCELDLHDVRLSVSKEKMCVGYWDGDKYIRCPKEAVVAKFGQCPECAGESFIPFQECIFDPKCDGEICNLEFCSREHLLYIAFYDTRMKIGMSSTRRIDRRLIEQGADAFSIVGKFQSRKKAREAEKAISSRLRIPQFHRQDILLRNLSRPLDVRGIEGRLQALRITLGEAFHLEPEPIKWLEDYPIELPLRESPKLQRTWGTHKGDLVGIKGKWLVFESNGLKALSLADLPSRFVARTVA